jgi:hypothetical protein
MEEEQSSESSGFLKKIRGRFAMSRHQRSKAGPVSATAEKAARLSFSHLGPLPEICGSLCLTES